MNTIISQIDSQLVEVVKTETKYTLRSLYIMKSRVQIHQLKNSAILVFYW